jgi:hypothetical protein
MKERVDSKMLSLFANETCLHGRNNYIGNVTAVCDGSFYHRQAMPLVPWRRLVRSRFQLCGYSAEFIKGQRRFVDPS